MTTRQLNQAVDNLLESADGYADLYSPGLNKTEDHQRLLEALIEGAQRELQHLSNYTRPLRLQEDAAETKSERYREAA